MKIMEPKFVDREIEIAKLLELSKQSSTLPIYVYGPEGCGKTRLFKEFIGMFDGIGVYIDALERSELDKALFLSPYIKDCSSLIAEILASTTGSIGRILADKIASILARIASRYKLKNSRIVLVVDDIAHAIGVDKVEWYIKWLYELEWKTIREHEPEAIVFIATTSEGTSLRKVLRHSYSTVKLIWNLPWNGYYQLALQLNPPQMDLIRESWKFTGGNPRKLIELALDYNWNINEWFKKQILRLEPLYREIKVKGLTNELNQVIENPDNIYHKASTRMDQLYHLLLDENLVIYKHMDTLTNTFIQVDSELGIGEYYAWQVPVYKLALEELLKTK